MTTIKDLKNKVVELRNQVKALQEVTGNDLKNYSDESSGLYIDLESVLQDLDNIYQLLRKKEGKND